MADSKCPIFKQCFLRWDWTCTYMYVHVLLRWLKLCKGTYYSSHCTPTFFRITCSCSSLSIPCTYTVYWSDWVQEITGRSVRQNSQGDLTGWSLMRPWRGFTIGSTGNQWLMTRAVFLQKHSHRLHLHLSVDKKIQFVIIYKFCNKRVIFNYNWHQIKFVISN